MLQSLSIFACTSTNLYFSITFNWDNSFFEKRTTYAYFWACMHGAMGLQITPCGYFFHDHSPSMQNWPLFLDGWIWWWIVICWPRPSEQGSVGNNRIEREHHYSISFIQNMMADIMKLCLVQIAEIVWFGALKSNWLGSEVSQFWKGQVVEHLFWPVCCVVPCFVN